MGTGCQTLDRKKGKFQTLLTEREQRVQQLREQIESAWADVPYPGDDRIAADPEHCDECEEVQTYFQGKHWKEIVTANDLLPSLEMSLLSGQAWHYYLPAYLIRFIESNREGWDDIEDSWEFFQWELTWPIREIGDHCRCRTSNLTKIQCNVLANIIDQELDSRDLFDFEVASLTAARDLWRSPPELGVNYDTIDRPTAFGPASSPILTSGYGANGLRAWKGSSSTGAATYFLYDGTNLLSAMNSAGTLISENTWGARGLVSRHSDASSASAFYSYDPQGNVVERQAATGTITASQIVDSYGVVQGTHDTTDPYLGLDGQDGYYTDYETGFELLTTRYYDPSAGRFISRDPAGYGGGMNMYAYANDDPQLFNDPIGTTPGLS